MTDTSVWVLLLSFGILLSFALMIAIFWLTSWIRHHAQGASPYTGIPLRRTTDLSLYYAEKIWRYMNAFQQYDNQPFQLSRSAFCRDTGRIFPNCVTWFDAVTIDWTFLQKRYPGNYVSWGSLNRDQQEAIRKAHDTLAGFQTDMSSPSPSPRAIEPEYVYTKPGPLYVDIQTKVLLGWKEVPGTDLEVLIVQKPVK